MNYGDLSPFTFLSRQVTTFKLAGAGAKGLRPDGKAATSRTHSKVIHRETLYGLRGLVTALVFFPTRRLRSQKGSVKVGTRRQVARTPKLVHTHPYYVFSRGAADVEHGH